MSEDVLLTVCEGLAVGLPPILACERAGISRRTLSTWQERGQKELDELAADEDPKPGTYGHFLQRFKITQAECARSQLELISDARRDKSLNWQAAAWIAERRWPEHFARKTLVEVSGDKGNVDLTTLSPEALAEIARGGK